MKPFSILLLTFALAACAHYEPYEYQPVADEMMQGPGIFTGESGEWTILSKKEKGDWAIFSE